MKRTLASLTSVLVVLCMLCTMTIGVTTVSAAEATKVIDMTKPEYTTLPADSVPDGWTNVGPKNIVLHGPTWGQFYAGTDYGFDTWGDSTLVTNDVWEGALTITLSQLNVYGGTGYIYFNYVDAGNYNAISFNSAVISLVDASGKAIATAAKAGIGEMKNFVVVKDADGNVAVTLGGEQLLAGKVDAAANGKVGFGFAAGGGYYALSKIENVGTISGVDPAPSDDPVTPPAKQVIDKSDYFTLEADTVPAGWTNVGTKNIVLHGPSWGQFYAGTEVEGNTWGDSALVTDNTWADELTISLDTLDVHGGTGYIYFNYADVNNYNAVEFTESAISLLEIVDGDLNSQPLDSVEVKGHGKKEKFVLTKDAEGNVAVTINGEELLAGKVDAAATGKVGFGFAAGGGYFALSRIENSIGGGENPQPTPPAEGTLYSQNFDKVESLADINWEQRKFNNGGDFVLANGTLQGLADGSLNFAICHDFTATEGYQIDVDIVGSNGNDTGNAPGIVFNYNSFGNNNASVGQGYWLSFGGNKADAPGTGVVSLYKLDWNIWSPAAIATANYSINSVNTVDAVRHVTIRYNTDGKITVDCTINGATTRLFDLTDTSWQLGGDVGKVGLVSRMSGAAFDNLVISELKDETFGFVTDTTASVDGDTVTVNYTLPTVENADSCSVWATIVDAKTGVLVGMNRVDASNNSVEITIPELPAGNYTAKVYLWDGNMQPLAHAGQTGFTK